MDGKIRFASYAINPAANELRKAGGLVLIFGAALVTVWLSTGYLHWHEPGDLAPPVVTPECNLTALPDIQRDPTFSPDGRP